MRAHLLATFGGRRTHRLLPAVNFDASSRRLSAVIEVARLSIAKISHYRHLTVSFLNVSYINDVKYIFAQDAILMCCYYYYYCHLEFAYYS